MYPKFILIYKSRNACVEVNSVTSYALPLLAHSMSPPQI